MLFIYPQLWPIFPASSNAIAASVGQETRWAHEEDLFWLLLKSKIAKKYDV